MDSQELHIDGLTLYGNCAHTCIHIQMNMCIHTNKRKTGSVHIFQFICSNSVFLFLFFCPFFSIMSVAFSTVELCFNLLYRDVYFCFLFFFSFLFLFLLCFVFLTLIRLIGKPVCHVPALLCCFVCFKIFV